MSQNSVNLCLVFHNHQPIGNFDNVFEAAFQDSYLPFLDVFEPYENLRLSLHISGSLMEWLDAHHGEYIDRVADLTAKGRIEIVGGAFFEPILTMIPSRDRVGQITSYSRWLRQRLSTDIRGIWIPERVWESSLVSDLAAADIEYTVLDDFHFKSAGLVDQQLHGHFVTEDSGSTVKVFPGSEKLRYLIPFAEPSESIDYLRGIADAHPGAVCAFGDDGEKFGTWPDTKKHVYEDGWLKRFFDALDENRDWLHTRTLHEAVLNTPPAGKIYLPDVSYREMTEWALPVSRQLDFQSLSHDLEHSPHWNQIHSFCRGGLWRNFKVKYPESNEMYARMMYVSSLLQQAEQEGKDNQQLEMARRHLYRGQCNCGYWHGAFGGLYLPHLRNAVYRELLLAEKLLDAVNDRGSEWAEATADDYNFDGRPEVRLASDRLVCWLAPAVGGRMYELDVREINHNLLATMQRRPEAYHEKVKAGENENAENTASIHDRVVFKQADLDQRLLYDSRSPKSLIDHFWDEQIDPATIASGAALERGDFADGEYTSKIRRRPGRVQVELKRTGNAWGVPITITKLVTVTAASDDIEVGYRLDGLPADRDFHFGIEFNFSGLPSGAEDRFFHLGDRSSIGQLQTELNEKNVTQINLRDEWLGIDVGLLFDREVDLWTYPIATVSQSEGGFELVHQSVVVQPHWSIRADASGQWTTTMKLVVDTSLAIEREGLGAEDNDNAVLRESSPETVR